MPEFKRWQTLDQPARIALSGRLLLENLHISAWHFNMRSQVFREVASTKIFNLSDY